MALSRQAQPEQAHPMNAGRAQTGLRRAIFGAARRAHMSGTITLNGIDVELDSDLGRAFITDATRAGEGVIADEDLVEKYELSSDELQKLANNKAIGRAIRNEREHRLRSGIATRELAARSYFKVPTVLDSILTNEEANARHRIESARELRVIATPENQVNPAAQSERFVIRIDLSAGGGPVETYDKAIKIDVNDSPPDAQPKLAAAPKLVVSNEGNNE
jgi:hypothetical protein